MTAKVIHGDCIVEMQRLIDEGVQVDAICTDPPYHLTSIVKRFGNNTAAPAKSDGATGVYSRSSSGFMGQKWDGGDIAFRVKTWELALALLKPGGHMLAFSGTRTYHRMVCAIEDAGFEIRDQIQWIYGSGFPKSHDVSKGIDASLGAEREIVAEKRKLQSYGHGVNEIYGGGPDKGCVQQITAPATDAAKQWEGWGTALKPAHEPVVVARKPLIGTVAQNVLAHGCGGLNIDGCRVGTSGATKRGSQAEYPKSADGTEDRSQNWARTGHEKVELPAGKWPSNLIHDGYPEVLEAFERFGENIASFFYTAKADDQDRAWSKHPTVKPQDLLRYLARLITPPGGTILDPFAGSGSLAPAAHAEGFNSILIEKQAEYIEDIERRVAALSDIEIALKISKKPVKEQSLDTLPLFGSKE